MATSTKEVQNIAYIYGLGRRKRSVARSKYYPTEEELTVLVNKKPIKTYFSDFYAETILAALNKMGVSKGRFELFINGGGTSGQAEAGRLAIAKSLLKADEGYRILLRMHGYLTTDIRKVLPKRAGLRKNRKPEQWSKR